MICCDQCDEWYHGDCLGITPEIGQEMKDDNRESRQVVVSCEAKKKQHVHVSSGLCDHYSELFTWMTVLNF